MRQISFLSSSAAIALAATALLSGPAMAQGAAASAASDDGADAIVVTAQRRAENLQKVPLAITTMNSAQLESQGINLLDEKIIAGAASQYGYAGYPWSSAPPLTYGVAVDFKF